MSVTHNYRRTAQHEAAHASALIMLGRLPKRVAADWPQEGVFGLMEFPWTDEGVTPEAAADLALAVLMGPLIEPPADSEWPPSWPPDMSAPGDEGQLAACVRYLKLNEKDWHTLIAQAHKLAELHEFQRLVGLIARALVLKDELDADDLRRLIGEETLAMRGIAADPPPEQE